MKNAFTDEHNHSSCKQANKQNLAFREKPTMD